MKSFFSAIGTFFGNLALRYGVLGLAMGMFAESLGIPTASVVLELTAGPLIIAGKTTFIEAVIFATAGLTLGSVVSYYMGYFGADLGKKLLNRGGKKARQQQSRFTANQITASATVGTRSAVRMVTVWAKWEPCTRSRKP